MKRILAIALVCLLYASPAWAAITNVGGTGSATSTTSNNTLAITTDATISVGEIEFILIAADNVGTSDASLNEITSVVDSSGNTYSKLCEFTHGSGGAGDAATVGLFFSKITSGVSIGGTITITFANTITSKAAHSRNYTVGAGMTVQQSAACVTESITLADPGSLAFSGLSNIERLYIRVIGGETTSTSALTATASFSLSPTSAQTASTGTGTTSMSLRGEFRIVTATGETSDPSTVADVDGASIFVALEEVAVPVTARPVAPIIFQ